MEMEKRRCPYCDVTEFRFKKRDIRFICAKCRGIVYNHDNPNVEYMKFAKEEQEWINMKN